MPTIPGQLTPNPFLQFFDDEGVPLANGTVATYVAGTTTPEPVYTDVLLTVPNSNPVILDVGGRAVIYLGPKAYKFVLKDFNDVLIREQDNIQNVGQVFLYNLGIILSTGTRDVVSGYTVVDLDQFVSVASSGGPDPCVVTLPTSVGRGLPITIKNMGSIAVALTPHVGETIDGVAGPYAIPSAASPLFPTVALTPNAPTGWDIFASHGI